MKEEQPHFDPDIQPLLDALQHHGRNQRRQDALSAKIDQMEATSNRRRRIWFGAVAAAVCLVLILFHHSDEDVLSNPTNHIIAEAKPSAADSESAPTFVPDTKPQTTIVKSPTILTHPLFSPQPVSNQEVAEETPFPQVAEEDAPILADMPNTPSPAEEELQAQAPQVFTRQSTRLVAKCDAPQKRKFTESPITFLAMSSAEDEGYSKNTFFIKDF